MNGTTYTITVVVKNAAGSSVASAPISVLPAAAPTAPTGPITAVAGNAQAHVTWNAPTSNGGSPILSYLVTSNPVGFSATVPAGGTLAADVLGLANGTSYRFRVQATNATGTGGPSAYSNPVTPSGPPNPPVITNATAGDHSANVIWDVPIANGSPIDSFTVTASPGGQHTTVPAPGSPKGGAVVMGLTNGVAYTFMVVAHNAAGNGPSSTPTSTVTPLASIDPIVYASTRTGTDAGKYQVYLMDTDESNSVQVLYDPSNLDSVPRLSPDGTQVAFQRGATRSKIWIVNIDGTGLHRLTTDATTVVESAPAWSPDGNHMAIVSSRAGSKGPSDIWIFDTRSANQDQPRDLTNSAGKAVIDDTPAWSANGRIAFSSNRDGNYDIWVMNADGTGTTTQVTVTGTPAANSAPDWDPTGTWLVYRSQSSVTSDWNIFKVLVSPTVGVPTQLTVDTHNDVAPQWSPDGSRIVLSSDRDRTPSVDGYDIYVMGADGSAPVRITFEQGFDAAPDW